MIARFFSWILSLTTFMAAFAAPALADSKRVALVIGNSAYKHSAELRNPRNDAEDVAAALQHLGFSVISGFDLDQSNMRRTIGRFAAALDDAVVGVFYYAGHGMQLNGTNYLVPTDSKLENQYSPQFELIPIGLVQSVMEKESARTSCSSTPAETIRSHAIWRAPWARDRPRSRSACRRRSGHWHLGQFFNATR